MPIHHLSPLFSETSRDLPEHPGHATHCPGSTGPSCRSTTSRDWLKIRHEDTWSVNTIVKSQWFCLCSNRIGAKKARARVIVDFKQVVSPEEDQMFNQVAYLTWRCLVNHKPSKYNLKQPEDLTWWYLNCLEVTVIDHCLNHKYCLGGWTHCCSESFWLMEHNILFLAKMCCQIFSLYTSVSIFVFI